VRTSGSSLRRGELGNPGLAEGPDARNDLLFEEEAAELDRVFGARELEVCPENAAFEAMVVFEPAIVFHELGARRRRALHCDAQRLEQDQPAARPHHASHLCDGAARFLPPRSR
jgi:hypothetical protein